MTLTVACPDVTSITIDQSPTGSKTFPLSGATQFTVYAGSGMTVTASDSNGNSHTN